MFGVVFMSADMAKKTKALVSYIATVVLVTHQPSYFTNSLQFFHCAARIISIEISFHTCVCAFLCTLRATTEQRLRLFCRIYLYL